MPRSKSPPPSRDSDSLISSRTDSVQNDTRGVSDALGYALLIAVVLTSVAVMYTVGWGLTTQMQHSEYMDNVERGFLVFSENLGDINQNDAPSRSTELKFYGGNLDMSGKTVFEVTVTDPETGATRNATFVTRTIEYSKQNDTVYYASGMVAREMNGQVGIIREPTFTFTDHQTRLSFLSLQPSNGTVNIGGTTTVLARAELQSKQLVDVVHRTSSENVTMNVTVQSPRYEVWARYFESEGLTRVSTSPSNNTVTFSHTTEHLYLRRLLIEVMFEQ